jgi:cytochrome P450
MANYTDMQIKMRNEIENIIGDRIALHEDKNSCHYVNAFISETLRFRPVAPLGVPHRALVDTQISKFFRDNQFLLKSYSDFNQKLLKFKDEYNIPKDTFVLGNLSVILNDEKYWNKPEVFNPNRFLTSNGEFTSNVKAFTPFGIGRRICLGEKLALADLFLITVRLLKSTSDYIFVLPKGDGSANLEPNPDVIFLSTAMPYKILLQKK